MMTNSKPSLKHRAAFTLIEVLFAAMLLGLGLFTLMTGLTTCLKTIKIASDFQGVQWVFGLAQLAYPVTDVEELEDLVVEPDDQLAEGFVFQRTIDEKLIENEETDDDGLYVMRSRVSWGNGGDGECEELVQYIWKKGAGEYIP